MAELSSLAVDLRSCGFGYNVGMEKRHKLMDIFSAKGRW